MIDALHGYAHALAEELEPAGLLDVLGALEGLSGALVHSEPLRRVLEDPNISVQTRRAIVQDLLESKAPKAAVDLASFAIGLSRPAELPNQLADLEALVSNLAHGEARDEEELTAGRSATKERLAGYAERVLEQLPAREQIDEVEDELFRLARIIDSEEALRRVLADNSLSSQGRAQVLVDLLSGKASTPTSRLASYAIRAGRTRDLVGTLDWLVERCAAERGRRVAEVHSKVELTEDERARLERALSRLVRRDVEVRVVLDPEMIGGALISVGDLVIDGSVRLRLERLRDALAQ